MSLNGDGKCRLIMISVQLILLGTLSACSGSEKPASTVPTTDATLISVNQTVEAAKKTLEAPNILTPSPTAQRKTPEPVPASKESGKTSDHLKIPDPRSIDVFEDTAFIAFAEGNADAGLLTLDVSDPRHPVVLNDLRFASSPDSYVATRDDIVFLTIYGGVLYSVDVRNPEQPIVLDHYSTGALTTGMELRDDLAFLPTVDAGISIIDVSDPGDLKLIGKYVPYWHGKPYISNAFVHGDTVFVALDDSTLKILDIHNPDDPYEISSLEFSSKVESAKFTDGIAYIGTEFSEDGGAGLYVVDISDPRQPEQIAYVEFPSIDFMELTDNLLLVESGASSTFDGGLCILDVTQPYKPTQLGCYELYYIEGLKIIGDLAVVVTRWDMRLLDMSHPKSLRSIGFNIEPTPTPTYTPTTVPPKIDIHISQLAYLEGSGIEDPLALNPPIKGKLIDTENGYAYVAAGQAGLRIINIQNPNSPEPTTYLPTDSKSLHIDVEEGTAYIGTEQGVEIIDVSDPESPKRLHTIVNHNPSAVVVKDKRCFIVGGSVLEIFDVSNPASPKKLVEHLLPDTARGIELDPTDPILYISLGRNKLELVEFGYVPDLRTRTISDIKIGEYPAASGTKLFATDFGKLRGFTRMPGLYLNLVGEYGSGTYSSGYEQMADTQGIRLRENLAYIADFRNGLYVLDVSDPEAMYVRGFYYPGELGWARDVEVEGGTVYLVSSDGGLRVLKAFGAIIPTKPLDKPTPTLLQPDTLVSDDGSNLQGKIVFLSSRDYPGQRAKMGPHEIYVMNADGSEQRSLTTNLQLSFSNSMIVSPDGDKIAIGSSSTGRNEVRIIDTLGNVLETISTGNQTSWLHDWNKGDMILLTLFSSGSNESVLAMLDVSTHQIIEFEGLPVRISYGAFSHDGQTIAYLHSPNGAPSTDELWLMDIDGSNRRFLVKRNAFDLTWSPNGKWLAFESYTDPRSSDAGYDIWIVSSDGSELRNLTRTPGRYNYTPTWSPDSRRIAYVPSTGDQDSHDQIVTRDIESGETEQLTFDGNNFAPYWVPEDDVQSNQTIGIDSLSGQIVFLSSRDYADYQTRSGDLGPHDIYALTPNSGQLTRITVGERLVNMGMPVVSPDGERIAFRGYSPDGINIISKDRQLLRSYPLPGQVGNAWVQEWSPLNDKLLITGFGDSPSSSDGSVLWNEEIYILDPETGHYTQMTDNNARNLFATWSPDGSRIAYMHDYWFWIMDADGANKHSFLGVEARDMAWSPNGEHIAFESQEVPSGGGAQNIWLVNSDGTDLRKLTDMTRDEMVYNPTWSPDGQYIAFQAHPNGSASTSQLFVVDVRTRKVEQVTFEGNNFAPYWVP